MLSSFNHVQLCEPKNYSLPDSSVHGIFQARVLEWVAIPFSGSSLTQGSNLGLPHCRWILYLLSHRGRPRILEWVACSFSSRSSQPRTWTGVSCLAGRFFTVWATRNINEVYTHTIASLLCGGLHIKNCKYGPIVELREAKKCSD